MKILYQFNNLLYIQECVVEKGPNIQKDVQMIAII